MSSHSLEELVYIFAVIYVRKKNVFFLFESQKTHTNDRTPKMNDFKKDGIGFIHADLYGI